MKTKARNWYLPLVLSFLVALPAMGAYDPPVRKRGSTTINVKNKGALGNGIKDDTAAFQSAVDSLPSSGGTVYVPDGTYMINPTKNVKLRSYMHLKLASGAKLKAISNSAERAYVLNALKVTEVEISGGKIEGDKYRHNGNEGEWGHGIMIRGSTHVTIRDIHISKCFGDGISIGGAMVIDHSHPAIRSEDVVISNIISTDNRRQALSIGQSYKVLVYDSEFSNTDGIDPSFGIDIEPDKINNGKTDFVHIENNLIRNNGGGGIQVYERVTGVTIKKNIIEHNGGFGILSIDGVNGYIALNQIRHNYWIGLGLRGETANFTVSQNTFRNNKTKQYGLTTKLNPLVTITGLKTGTGGHVEKTSGTSNIQIKTNYYAR